MKVEITLNDNEGQPVAIVSNCQQRGFVNIKILCDGSDNLEVSVEDLKLALRKLSIK